MKKVFCVIVLVGVLSGCTNTSMMNLAPEEKECLETAKLCPLEFSIPKTEAEDAWGRAQSFIGRFSSMKIQTATDYVIQTYNPSGSDVSFGYYVTKTPIGDEVQFSVECTSGNMFSGGDAKNNAHLLAYFIRSGELCNPKMISK